MNTWIAANEVTETRDGIRLLITDAGASLSYAAVIDLWANSEPFRTFFNAALAGISFGAFRWETPPVTRETSNRPFECVVLDSPDLARPCEPEVFSRQFGACRAPMVTGFFNLGNDAFMVVPCPGEPSQAYAHLAVFVREAPAMQRDRLWQEVGKAMARQLGGKPVWLNTAGAGVAWLHVRLDSRPKYYHHAPYRQIDDI